MRGCVEDKLLEVLIGYVDHVLIKCTERGLFLNRGRNENNKRKEEVGWW